jgi:hypothetical protein
MPHLPNDCIGLIFEAIPRKRRLYVGVWRAAHEVSRHWRRLMESQDSVLFIACSAPSIQKQTACKLPMWAKHVVMYTVGLSSTYPRRLQLEQYTNVRSLTLYATDRRRKYRSSPDRVYSYYTKRATAPLDARLDSIDGLPPNITYLDLHCDISFRTEDILQYKLLRQLYIDKCMIALGSYHSTLIGLAPHLEYLSMNWKGCWTYLTAILQDLHDILINPGNLQGFDLHGCRVSDDYPRQYQVLKYKSWLITPQPYSIKFRRSMDRV